jgi:hypothetical protein
MGKRRNNIVMKLEREKRMKVGGIKSCKIDFSLNLLMCISYFRC